MANKLKNMRLTSVDMVRNGANQKADICLFKSAEPTDEPTEHETNIFKRFLNWLRENPAEGEFEPESPVEKADDQPNIVDIYKSAITESLQSIATDDSLTEIEKNDMIAKSLDEYHEAMVELLVFGTDEELQKAADEDDDLDDWEWDEEEVETVEKFNPNHDSLGRFASSGGAGGASGSGKSGKAKTKVDDHKQTREVRNLAGYVGDEKVQAAVEAELKADLSHDSRVRFGGIESIGFFGAGEVEGGKTTALVQYWGKNIETGKRVKMETQINDITVLAKSYDIDEIEEV